MERINVFGMCKDNSNKGNHIQQCTLSKSYRIALVLILSLFALFLIASSTALSESSDADDPPTSGNCGDGLHWDYNGDTLTISKEEGEHTWVMNDYDNEYGDNRPWRPLDYDKIQTIRITKDITHIGSWAFSQFKSFTNLEIINDSKNTISDSFVGFSNLKSIGAGAFNYCGSFESDLKLPESIEDIGDQAFRMCPLHGNLVIPTGLTEIKNATFTGCCFTGSLIIPNNITSIGNYAFSDCDFTGSLIIPESVTSIGVGAFKECKFNGTLSLPDSLKSIGKEAFSHCNFIGSLTIPSGITVIEDYAFACNNFTGKLNLPEGLTKIGAYAFDEYIDNDLTLEIPKNVREIGEYAFKNCEFYDLVYPVHVHSCLKAFYGAKFACDLKIPESVEAILDYMFTGATFNGCLYIPESVKTIGLGAFEESTFLGYPNNNHVISDSVTSISQSAFKDAKLLDGSGNTSSLVLSRNLKSIGNEAFNSSNIIIKELVLGPDFDDSDKSFDNTTIEKLIVMDCGSVEIDFTPWKLYTENDIEITDYSSSDFYEHVFIKTDQYKMVRQSGTISENQVTYDINGGSGLTPSAAYYYNTEKFKLKDFTGSKTGYSFMGWDYNGETKNPGDEITMGDKPITLKAIWVGSYKVAYDANGGSAKAPETKEYKKGDTVIVEGYSGTKSGYEFDGWFYKGDVYRQGDKIIVQDSNITLMANWVQLHKVIYDLNGGSGPAPTQADVKEGESFTVKSYSGSRDGYQFEGWIHDGKCYQSGERIVMGKSDLALLASWVKLHSVTYDLNGGTGAAPTQSDVAEKEDFTVKGCTATKDGFTFGGWSYDRNTYQEGDTITMGLKDIVLQAVWKKGQPMHKVTYDLNGGSGPAPIQADVQEGSTFIVKMYSGTNEGYTFKGWYYNYVLYNMGSVIKMGTQDIVLKAVWGPGGSEGDDFESKLLMIAAAAIGGIVAVGAVAFMFVRRI